MKYKEFIIQNYPNGFTFEPMAIRLLEEKAGIGKWDDETIDNLKAQAVRRQDGIYVFSEQIADEKTRREIVNTAEEWIATFGCFSLNTLQQRFQLKIQNLSDNILDFERFLDRLQEYEAYKHTWHNQNKSVARFTRAIGVAKDVALERIVSQIENVINVQLHATEYDIIEKIPALDTNLLSTIVKDRLPLVMKTESDGLVWYLKQEMSIPDDFGDKITEAIEQLEAVNVPVSEEALHVVLSLAYQANFNTTYQITDKKTFRNLVEQHYKGERREWKGGIFRQIETTK
ncbi:hypothetical protein FACS1894170_03080 [Planctomycetales bacterium]|nr:hypothetical protein FACS1894170_03080 [Planctomycetales bacterium]